MESEVHSDSVSKSASTSNETALASENAAAAVRDETMVADAVGGETAATATGGAPGDTGRNVHHNAPAAVGSKEGDHEPPTKAIAGGEERPQACAPEPNGENHEPGTGHTYPRVVPTIEREQSDRIDVGGGGKLIVPREDIATESDVGEELDLQVLQAKKIRKPERREWIALRPESELPTRLLIHKPKPDGFDVEYYYIAQHLRSPIRGELKDVRVFLYYSFKTDNYALWVINVTIENSWYESLQTLLNQPPEFFSEKAIRVFSEKPRYRIKHKPMPGRVEWPTKSTEELFGEALGPERFISTPDHPIYAALVEGVEL